MSELEDRVDEIEKEIAQLKQKLEQKEKLPWWERIAGSFDGDAAYEEAMKLGAEYRRSNDGKNGNEKAD